MGALGSLARITHALLLAVWLGSSVAIALFLAPSAFEIIPSRDLAGNLVAVVLERFDVYALIAGPLLLITLWVGWMPLGLRVRARTAGVLLMIVAAGVSGLLVSPKMLAVRRAMGRKIEELALQDPLRAQFAQLHTVSTSLLLLHLAVAALLLAAVVMASAPKPRFGIQL